MVGNPKGRTANGRGRESRLSFYSVFHVILDVVSRASLGISKVFQVVTAVVNRWRLLVVQFVREEPSDVLLLLVTENPPSFLPLGCLWKMICNAWSQFTALGHQLTFFEEEEEEEEEPR